MLAVAGVTAMETSVGEPTAVTVRAAVPVTAESVAVTLADPAATPVASPDPLMVVAAVLLTAQVTVEVMLAVEPSL